MVDKSSKDVNFSFWCSRGTSYCAKCLFFSALYHDLWAKPDQPENSRKIYVYARAQFITNFIFRWKVSELIINGVQRQDDGLYECQARNEGGQFFKSGHIQVCTFSWNTRFWHFFCSLKFLNKCSVVKNSAYFLSMCNSKRHTDFDIRYHEGIFLLKKFWWWVVISPEFSIIFLSSPRPWHYFLLFLAPL